MLAVVGGDLPECIFFVVIVGIDPGGYFSSGFFESFFQRIALPLVWPGHPIMYPVGVFFYDLYGIVGAAAVDDDVFQVGIMLIEYGLYGLFEIVPLVIAGSDDGNFWRMHIVTF